MPITAVSGVFIHNGVRRPLANLSMDASAIAGRSVDVEVYFAAHPAYQSWNDAFSAEVTFEVGGRRVTSEAAIRVFRVTPPKVPDVGEGRTNPFGSEERCVIRVLSPRIDPPVRFDVGSTARTATRCPCAIKLRPN